MFSDCALNVDGGSARRTARAGVLLGVLCAAVLAGGCDSSSTSTEPLQTLTAATAPQVIRVNENSKVRFTAADVAIFDRIRCGSAAAAILSPGHVNEAFGDAAGGSSTHLLVATSRKGVVVVTCTATS